MLKKKHIALQGIYKVRRKFEKCYNISALSTNCFYLLLERFSDYVLIGKVMSIQIHKKKIVIQINLIIDESQSSD